MFYNYGGTLNLGSNETERIIIQNNSIEGKKHVYLFYNTYNSSTTINSKKIYISNNELISSTEEESILFNNKGILKLGSDETEMLEIKENKLTDKNYVNLFYNRSSSTTINSKK